MKKALLLLFVALVISVNLHAQRGCKVVMTSIDGDYEGDCKKGYAHGQGKAIGEDMYEGDFKKGYPWGVGTYTWADGGIYEGNWKKGLRDGWGSMTTSDGKESRGIWKDDEFVKEQMYEVQHEVTSQLNVKSVTFKKKGDGQNRVTVILKRKDGATIGVQNMTFLNSSGSRRVERDRILIAGNVYPFTFSINFDAPNQLGTTQTQVQVETRIFEPGEWEILINF